MRQRFLYLLAFACGFLSQTRAMGTPYTWTGGNGVWENSIHWSPNSGPPQAGDTATISGPLNTIIDVSPSANVLGTKAPAGLKIGNFVRFDNAGFQMNVDGPVSIQGGATTFDVLPVTADADLTGFEADSLEIDQNSDMRILQGRLKVGSLQQRSGTIWIDGGGTIVGGLGSMLNIGDAAGVADAQFNVWNGGTGVLDAPVTFRPDADVDVFANSTLQLRKNATFSGGGLYTGSGLLQLDGAETLVISATTINMPNGRVDLDGSGGNLSVGQKLTIFGDFTVKAQSIDTSDNVFGNANLIGEDTIEINHLGQLDIQLTDAAAAWTMAGHLEINGPSLPLVGTHLAGSPLILSGTASVKGNSRWLSRTDISGDVNLDANAELTLGGGTLGIPNQLLEGEILGAGTLAANPGTALMGKGTLSTKINFAGNAELRASNGKLVLSPSAELLQVGTIGTRNADSILEVQKAWNTEVAAGGLELKGGEVVGGAIQNDGLTKGHGRIATAGFSNRGTLRPQGGELIIDTANAPDLDGGGGLLNPTGDIDASQGNLRVKQAPTDGLNGVVTVGPGHTVHFEQGWALETGNLVAPTGTLNLQGGASIATRATVQGGAQVLKGVVNVDQEGAFEAPTTFASTAHINLPGSNDTLRLFQSSVVESGASFGGGGSLVNTGPNNALTLQGGAVISVRVFNAGDLIVESAALDASVKELELTSLSELQLDILGKLPTQYDTLIVGDHATLKGRLSVSTQAPGSNYVDPAVRGTSDTFALLGAQDGITGSFSSVLYNGQLLMPSAIGIDGSFQIHVGNGLFRKMTYTPNIVALVNLFAKQGDLNADQSVDASDAAIMFANWGTHTPDWSLGDVTGDGVVDAADAGEMFAQWTGDSVPASVPEPTGFAILALLALASSRFRHR